MSWLRSLRTRHALTHHPLPEAEWQAAVIRLPILAGFDAATLNELGHRAWRRLFELRLTLAEEMEWDDIDRLVLAAQIDLMTLGWRNHASAFANLHEVIVLPDAFRRRVEEMDEAGVVHEYVDERAGETSYQGPIVLSRADLDASGHWNGFNVVIHEFAHKLDMANSMDVDGCPPLPADISARQWYRIFTAVWEELQACLESGRPTPIDAYAATHPGECFAVCCEAFFTAPAQLANHWPELHELLMRYFRQNPLERWQQLSHNAPTTAIF
ncbi:zinc-dependent peptidase [Kushneria phosphatilytica]|uniref:Zinc-dependent peptidase n=1 Tax=Kushneria phosphatilytica TaxID=657387 RepID=A0A1S1NZT1_9GAMM|nr:M90 family metallopeptidase [Kushneria phosphatilytica]OHV13800.1 hypothetical protein BH688_00065 [Kushneria phosphatilytica]QEL10350.1 zinc-dependent peptidase [Kushneria phosphatilytica]